MNTPPTISEVSKLEMLRLFRSKPGLTQREVATHLGISVGKVNYCLHALIEKGLVKAEDDRNSENKLAYLYLLTPSGIAEKAHMTREFLSWKVREYEALQREI